jgi:hypothetical protein
MQILADRLEFCWIHLRGIGALENSLWGYDGSGIRVWLNALAIEAPQQSAVDAGSPAGRDVQASTHIPFDFYPLCEWHVLDAVGERTAQMYHSHSDGQGDHHRSRIRSCHPPDATYGPFPALDQRMLLARCGRLMFTHLSV